MESDAVVSKKLQRWTLEPALLLLFFGWFLSASIVTNQILRQTCLYTFGYDFFTCSHLDDKNSTETEQEIQPYVASILMTVNICNSLIPTILSLFLGPWSDKYGRKQVICCIFSGYTISMGWITLVSYFSENISTNSPWNYLFAQLPLMICGGQPTLVIVILCYITDQTDETNRSLRFTIVEIIIFMGVLIALASSSFILQVSSATAVFCLSFAFIFAGTVIVTFFVEETVHKKDDVGWVEQYKDLFTTSRITELFRVYVQKRSSNNRKILWTLMIILILANFTTQGSHTVFYLFTRQKFGWNLQDLTLYEATSMLLTIVGSIIALAVLKKFLNFSDLSLSILSLSSLAVDALIKTFASHSWHLYMASVVALFKIVSYPMLRSIMSTVVAKNEISVIYGVTTSMEAISGLAAAPLYAATYSATLLSFPSAFNLITATIFISTLILAFLIARWFRTADMNTKTIQTKL